MPRIEWFIEGDAYGSCNCDFGCPCQFESRPTHGNCHGFEVAEIARGYFGEVNLDGLRYAAFYAWPGAIYEGRGEVQVVIDERATEAQRQALLTILEGGETDEGATHWWVFHTMSETVHEPLYRKIELSVDIDGRVAEATIPGVLKSRAEPIRSPVNGKPHRVRIDLPQGIEFGIAEIGSGTSEANGAIRFDLRNSYAQFNRLRHNGRGLVR
jgi:hypothetical protein